MAGTRNWRAKAFRSGVELSWVAVRCGWPPAPVMEISGSTLAPSMVPGVRDGRPAGSEAGPWPGSVAVEDDEPQPAVKPRATQARAEAVSFPRVRLMGIGRVRGG